jgi:hypothetical protein
LLSAALVIGLAAVISTGGNLDILLQALGWLAVLLFGLSALVVGADLGEERLSSGLFWAGLLWLVLWPLPRAFGWIDNRNLTSVWPAMAVIVLLYRGKPWWWALPYIGVLVLMGSRGAILGLSVALLIWYRPRWNARQVALLAVVGLVFLGALTALRPRQAFNRFEYWRLSFQALVDHNLWIGLGPGGIAARRTLLEPGADPSLSQSYHLHAHNLLIQVLTELGLLGVLALGLSAIKALRTPIHGRWQLPILAGVLIHCLVDLPLYFPGPLLIFMLIAGSMKDGLAHKEQGAESLAGDRDV